MCELKLDLFVRSVMKSDCTSRTSSVFPGEDRIGMESNRKYERQRTILFTDLSLPPMQLWPEGWASSAYRTAASATFATAAGSALRMCFAMRLM